MYQPRTYRQQQAPQGLVCFNVTQGESDLFIAVTPPLGNAIAVATGALKETRALLTDYIRENPCFLTSLSPIPPVPGACAFVQSMCRAAVMCGVGPMAAVAGAVAQAVGEAIGCEEIIVENGGDCYLRLTRERIVGLYAGPSSPFTGRVGLRLGPGRWGLCTSAGTHGHSLSFGRADAAVVLVNATALPGEYYAGALSDAAATALGNKITRADDLQSALEQVCGLPGVAGALGVAENKIACLGSIELAY